MRRSWSENSILRRRRRRRLRRNFCKSGGIALDLARWSNLEYETAGAPNKTAKSSQIAWGRFSMHFDRVHRSAPECTVGGGGTRGGYYQHRLEWRSWVAGRSFAQGLSQRPNAVTTSNISTVKSWRIHGEILSLSIACPDRTLTPISMGGIRGIFSFATGGIKANSNGYQQRSSGARR